MIQCVVCGCPDLNDKSRPVRTGSLYLQGCMQKAVPVLEGYQKSKDGQTYLMNWTSGMLRAS
jgi:hypothetical protein